MDKEVLDKIIETCPFECGIKDYLNGKTIHDNPFKSPNISKTDDVKSEAWLRGYLKNYF